MQFRDLKAQYTRLKSDIDAGIQSVIDSSAFISGREVAELESILADYVGVKHCISCGNGTDALLLAAMVLGIGAGDVVFVPDFTFFSSGEIVSTVGATPVFVDVEEDTFNISPSSLEDAIINVLEEGKYTPKAIVAVDLFGLPADYTRIKPIANKYNLKIIEDGAQGFGGELNGAKACSFGDISTTSFFPAKPLGCYGDGGAVFTDDDALAELISSLRVHGKGKDKYDNIRIGMNSRLDTIQAAVLMEKFKAFKAYELENINKIADIYTAALSSVVKVPSIRDGFLSSWAQYTVLLPDAGRRLALQEKLREKNIPSMIYYKKPMHLQTAFATADCVKTNLSTTESICDRVLSLPIHPYMDFADQEMVISTIKDFFVNVM